MLIKTLILTALLAFSLYSEETNATTNITSPQCTLGLLPFGTTFSEDTKASDIVATFEQKGFFVTILTNPAQLKDVDFISDASIECTPTYFGIMSKTSVRIVETSSNKTIAEATSPAVGNMLLCKIDLFNAIKALPNCQIK